MGSWGARRDGLVDGGAGDVGEPSGADLERRAEAAWTAGDYDEAFRLRESAFARHLQQREDPQAGHAAIMLAADYYQRGELAVAAGWHGTAEKLLEGQEECRAHGLAAWVRSQITLLFEKDLDAASALAQQTTEIGRRLGDADVEMLGLATQARTLTRQGHTKEGTQLIDEAMAAAVSGRLGAYASCNVFCHTLSSCHELADYRRGAEWAEAAQKCCARDRILPASGDCRIHKAGILRRRGAWAEAEEEANRGCVEHSANVLHIALGQYELGEIRLHRGDLDAAEEAFSKAHELGRVPQPGLALLRLAQGNVVAATALLDAALDDETLELARADLLTAQVEIALAADNIEKAQAATTELGRIAARFGTVALAASVATADGRVQMAQGDAAEARATLRRAQGLWQEAGVPYEAARSRAVLGEAALALGDAESAALELQAAHRTFERLGAVRDDRRVTAALRSLVASVDPGVSDAKRVVRTFMFTDIVDSTPLAEAIGDDSWIHLRRWHDETLRRLFAEHRGDEIDHAGDGFFVSFDDANRGLMCAVDIQRTLADHRRAHGFAPQVRIGLHTCKAIRRGSGYQGTGVHVAARVGAQARGEEIIASAETLAEAGSELPISASREVKLKGLSEPVEIVAVRWA